LEEVSWFCFGRVGIFSIVAICYYVLLVSFYVNPAKAAKAYQRENKMKRRNKKEIPDEK
jgi:hypothetical protein